MDASHCYLIKGDHLGSSLQMPRPNFFSFPSQKPHTHQLGFSLSNLGSRPRRQLNQQPTVVMDCAKGDPVRELEEDNEWWVGIGESWMEKCQGEGKVEVLECLEREAIMGEDEGKEPSDYNRRAHIFDKSSRVFQALKEEQSDSEIFIS